MREFLRRELTPELVRGTDLHESLFPPPAIAMPAGERRGWQEKAVARVRERYSWEAVTDQYEALLRGL